jgi:hypothetical protein
LCISSKLPEARGPMLLQVLSENDDRGVLNQREKKKHEVINERSRAYAQETGERVICREGSVSRDIMSCESEGASSLKLFSSSERSCVKGASGCEGR